MAKGRNDVTNVINTNVYDNNNKEIVASLVRAVLFELRDSYFNLIDDQLRNAMYNETTTLEQHLSTIVGALPVSGFVNGVDPGQPINVIYGVSGIVSSAKSIANNAADILVEVNFSQSIANKRLIPVVYFDPTISWDANNDIGGIVLLRISSTRIWMALRDLQRGGVQKLNIEIIAL